MPDAFWRETPDFCIILLEANNIVLTAFRNHATATVTTLASIVTIVLYINNIIYPQFNGDTKIAVAVIGIIFLYYFCENLYLRFSLRRKRSYEQSLSLIFDGLVDVHESIRKQSTEKSDNIPNMSLSSLETLCNFLSKAFEEITGNRCAITIKLMTVDVDGDGDVKLKSVTLCRDDYSNRYRLQKNDGPLVKHWIELNTGFSQILYDPSQDNYFYSNRLPLLLDYRNTSFVIYGDPIKVDSFFSLKIFQRYRYWPLPYKSTITVPIVPGNQENLDGLAGFLCVDSPAMGAFNGKNDVRLLMGVANIVFSSVDYLSRNMDEFSS